MSSSTNPGDRSAAEIEREVERTRARLTGTVEELKGRVSPGQLAEQTMDWLRGSGGREFVGNLGTTLRDNPMPVLLIAAGIGWMALGGQRNGHSDSRPRGRWTDSTWRGESYAGEDYGEYAGESYPPGTYARQPGDDTGSPSLTERAGDAASSLRDSASGMASRAGETASNLRDSVAGAAQRAGDMASRAGDAASDALSAAKDRASSLASGASQAGRRVSARAGEVLHRAGDTAHGIGERASYAGERVRRNISETVESQPLLLGAVGLALGAALGALFPATEAEDRLMGETRDRVADRMTSLAGEAYDQARETAGEQLNRAGERLGEAYGNARDKLAESGVSPRQGAAALGEIARDLRETVERTAHDATSAARNATDRPAGSGPSSGPTPGGSATRPEGGGPV